MAIYEYYCPECHQQFQLQMPIVEYSTGVIPRCPHCGSTEAQRILSPPTIGTAPRNPGGYGGGCCRGGCCEG